MEEKTMSNGWPSKGQTWKHRKGSLYIVVCVAFKESDGTDLVVYALEDGTGSNFVRPLKEFWEIFTLVKFTDKTLADRLREYAEIYDEDCSSPGVMASDLREAANEIDMATELRERLKICAITSLHGGLNHGTNEPN